MTATAANPTGRLDCMDWKALVEFEGLALRNAFSVASLPVQEKALDAAIKVEGFVDAICSDRKIASIRILREATGLSLKSSKLLADSYLAHFAWIIPPSRDAALRGRR